MTKQSWAILGILAVSLGLAGIIIATRHPGTPRPAPAAVVPPAPKAAAPTAVPLAPFACRFPDSPPGQPDGATATAADMKASHDAIQHYVELLEAFQACRNKQIDDTTLQATAAQKLTWLNEGNDAVDKANDMAAQFSAQLKIWRSKNPGK